MSRRRVSVDLPDARCIGLISDTHGRLRPDAAAYLEGVDVILHAGDVGSGLILERLASIAPVYTVRGNVDYGDYADALPHEIVARLGGLRLYMVHQPGHIALDGIGSRGPGRHGVDVVVHGHTHLPRLDRIDGVCYVNPGSAGPRRFDKPVTLGRLDVPEHPGNEPDVAIWDLERKACWIP